MKMAHHRNGISGRSFHVVLFDGEDGNKMLAIVPDDGTQEAFKADGVECYALDINELAKGNIAFAEGNSWRGDDIMARLVKMGFNELACP